MTRTKKRMQTGGFLEGWGEWLKQKFTSSGAPVIAPDEGQVQDQVRTEDQDQVDSQYQGQYGGSRRRRRCTKKHRHSTACKRKSKGKRTKGRKRH
jgi:hypothetical protein